MHSTYEDIIAIDVYIENRKTRTRVGQLTLHEDGYKFCYEDNYLHEKTAISLGPDLPLTRRSFTAQKLFGSFQDRIPSKENAAYPEYCEHFGISPNETDEFILLATVGSRGPSSFILEPVYRETFDAEQLITFRKKLSLSVRDFAALFDISASSLSKIENRHSSGRDILKRIEIYINFPQVALFEVKRNKAKVHTDVFKRVLKIFSE